MRSERFYFGSPVSERATLFGACRPGTDQEQVAEWIAFMKSKGITRVLCLLTDYELRRYGGLLERYREAFGDDNVAWAPVGDYRLASLETMTEVVLPFLLEGERAGAKTVAHCAAGVGRTGLVLAAWLVAARGYSNEAPITAVLANGRNPRESGDLSLDALLNACREYSTRFREE